MQLSPKDLWTRVLDEARGELPDHTVRTWLEPVEPIALEENTLVVGAPDQFAVEWNETKHAALLTKLAQRTADAPITVVFRVAPEQQKRPQMDLFVAPTPAATPATKQNPSSQPLNERYTFET